MARPIVAYVPTQHAPCSADDLALGILGGVIRFVRPPLKLVIFCLLPTIALVVGCLGTYAEGRDLRDNAVRTSATVTAAYHGRLTTWNLVFPEAGGLPQRVVRNVEYLKGNPKVGDQVEVYYSLADPTDDEEVTDVRFGTPGSHHFSRAWKLGLGALIPLAICLCGAVKRTRRSHGQRKANPGDEHEPPVSP
jgi:hypothetical protein